MRTNTDNTAQNGEGNTSIRGNRDGRLGGQPGELERVTALNDVIRGVNEAQISATSREELASTVCERMADSDLYRVVCMADVPTLSGRADRWTIASTTDGRQTPPTFSDEEFDRKETTITEPPSTIATVDGWTMVSISYDSTVYGALGILPSKPTVCSRERTVLTELGEVIGHAIDAVETRHLLAEEAVIELELRNSNPGAPLVEAAAQCECQLVLESVIPETSVAYLAVENAPVETVTEEFANASTGDVRLIREDEKGDRGVLEWSVPGDSLLGRLVNHGANVTGVTADRNAATYTVELASDAGVRTLLERVQHSFPETRLDAKREVNRPYEPADKVTGQRVEKLTERQQDVMETAFRAGYYQWPRDSTAEEIAEMLGIAAPTLHAHLRKAENRLLGHLFDTVSRRGRDSSPGR